MRLDLAWRSKETNQVGINEFASWAKKADIEMMLAVNLGSRDLNAARAFAEYCNHPGGTAWSDLRRSHGVEEPYDVRMWCLGNEMDGPWQIGHKVAQEYGRLANETAKAMKPLGKNVELVVCGSSNDAMPTYPEWEREVLEECYENVDYISLHKYFGNSSRDTLNYFGKIEETGRYIQAIGGVIDCVKAKKRAKNDVYICFDEWNVWYHNREEDSKALADLGLARGAAAARGGLQPRGRALHRRPAQRVHPPQRPGEDRLHRPARERHRPDPHRDAAAAAWKTSIYYPYQFASLYGRGTALNVAVDAPTYDCEVAQDVSYLDVAAVDNTGDGMVTVFILNRHLDRGDGARHGPPRLRRADARQAPDHGRPGPGPARGQHRRRPGPGRAARRQGPRRRGRPAGWFAAAACPIMWFACAARRREAAGTSRAMGRKLGRCRE